MAIMIIVPEFMDLTFILAYIRITSVVILFYNYQCRRILCTAG
jgi:hypothetical protein